MSGAVTTVPLTLVLTFFGQNKRDLILLIFDKLLTFQMLYFKVIFPFFKIAIFSLSFLLPDKRYDILINLLMQYLI